MPENRGSATAYVAGDGHRPIPKADDLLYRRAHAPQPKKPTGLDWDALTPRCKTCGQKSGQLDNTDTCPTCRGVQPSKTPTTKAAGYASAEQPAEVLERRFTAPVDIPLEVELDDLEDTDPDVAAAAAAYDDMADRITHPDDHVRAPEPTTTQKPAGHPAEDEVERGSANVVPTQLPQTPEEETSAHDQGVAAAADPQETTPAPPSDIRVDPIDLGTPDAYSDQANLAAQLQHVTRVLTDTAGSADPVVRLLRLNAFSAIEALHLHTILHPQTAALATSTPASAAPDSTEPTPRGSVGTRPAAATGGEARRQPATRATRSDATPVDEQAIVREYVAGDSRPAIARRHGVRPKRITAILERHRVELRDDRTTNSGGTPLELTDAEADVIRAAYVDDGDSIATIADRTGHGRRQIADLLRNAGVAIRAAAHEGKPITSELVDEFVARYQGGESLQRLATDHHIKKDRVRQVLEDRGVEIRSSGGPQAVRKPGTDAAAVRAWAVDQGLMPAGQSGRLPNRVIDAYAAAHPTSTTNQSGDTAA